MEIVATANVIESGNDENGSRNQGDVEPGCSSKSPDDVVSCEVKPLSKRKKLYEWEKGSYTIKECPDTIPHKCIFKESGFSRVVYYQFQDKKAVYYNTPWKKIKQIKSENAMKRELQKRYSIRTVTFLYDFDTKNCRCPD